jgi:hypothetical protein
MTRTIEERKTRKVHAAGEAAGRTLCGRLIRTRPHGLKIWVSEHGFHGSVEDAAPIGRDV